MQRKKTFLVVCVSMLTAASLGQSRPAGFGDKIVYVPGSRSFVQPGLPQVWALSGLSGYCRFQLVARSLQPMADRATAHAVVRPFQPVADRVQVVALPSQPMAEPVESVARPLRFNAVDAGFYSAHLGFFCKEELSVQRTTRLPVFFRLGSLEYTNKLEGK